MLFIPTEYMVANFSQNWKMSYKNWKQKQKQKPNLKNHGLAAA